MPGAEDSPVGKSAGPESAGSTGRPLRGAATSARATGRPCSPSTSATRSYVAVIEPDTAFWALVPRENLAELALGGPSAQGVSPEGRTSSPGRCTTLRFGLKPSAVYFNPTERCNLNCTYCYIPEKMRRRGQHMSREKLLEALAILKRYFQRHAARGQSLPQIIFHGAEPLLNREAVFAGIEQYARRLPLRHPDQRHAAGRLGHRLSPRGTR